ncbi:sigma-54-dependent Fis family transcriptional regulator [Lentibacillus halophilus]|uniref:Sigma-54-dependent Fis family transcriptional regulator n=1 Tax=Lentibacillus halophilus TaxID=295065 RepID=A0ABP3J388_9BACI
MLSTIKEYKEEVIETVFEKSHFCFVAIDENGVITYLNNSYCHFLGVTKEESIGKHVTAIIENTRLHVVAETGQEEIADLQYIRGNHMVANRIPVFSNGKSVGAVGTVLYRDKKEWMKMNTHIKNLLLEIEHYRKRLNDDHGATYSLHDIVGSSPQLYDVKGKVKKLAPGDITILLQGESGTGKELFAHSIHQLSERHTAPFIKINCAAIPEGLLETELFGYVPGAFTGAKKEGKQGKFQLADGGTLFLDEIGDMPLDAQVKILRVLQEGEVEQIGSEKSQKVDVRIIAATNQSLETLVEQQRFREDLYYRINVLRLRIPPLRERREDVRILAKYMIHKVSNRTGQRVVDADPDVLQFFQQYDWPGNVREMENVIESAVHLSDSEMITMDDLPDQMQLDGYITNQDMTLKNILEKAELQAVKHALNKTNGDKRKAANLLDIGKSSFYEKVKKYDL